MTLKSVIQSMPILRAILKTRKDRLSGVEFIQSSDYWDTRYRLGGNSGAGSYNRLAKFKSEFVNRFISQGNYHSVIEFGCGDGAQLELANYPQYTGVDVSQTVIRHCQERFSHKETFSFLHTSEVATDTGADVALSLDVIYHLVEDDVYHEYMNSVFSAARKSVVIYSSNVDFPWPSPHVRHRRFTDWVDRNRSDFVLTEHLPNRFPFEADNQDNTSFADFYVFMRSSQTL